MAQHLTLIIPSFLCSGKSEVFEGGASGFVLGGLFARSPSFAPFFATNENLDGKAFVVIGAYFLNQTIFRGNLVALLDDLLELGLVVGQVFGARHFFERFKNPATDEGHNFVPAQGEVDGPNHGFERGPQKDRTVPSSHLIFAATDTDRFGQPQFASSPAKCGSADNPSFAFGQFAFLCSLETAKEVFGGQQTDHGIAEKLEAFVVVGKLVLESVGAVGECPVNQVQCFLPGLEAESFEKAEQLFATVEIHSRTPAFLASRKER